MSQLATKSAFNRKIVLGSAAVAVVSSQFFFFGGWKNRKIIYPPTDITTKNRLFPTYVNNQGELHDLLLFKEPLILNFTIMAEERSNKLTLSLFQLLGYKENYPEGSKPCNLASISSDSEDGREMMLTYGVNTLPSLVCLHNQIPVGRYNFKGEEVDEKELKAWISEQTK